MFHSWSLSSVRIFIIWMISFIGFNVTLSACLLSHRSITVMCFHTRAQYLTWFPTSEKTVHTWAQNYLPKSILSGRAAAAKWWYHKLLSADQNLATFEWKSDQTTPTQSWWCKLNEALTVRHLKSKSSSFQTIVSLSLLHFLHVLE